VLLNTPIRFVFNDRHEFVSSSAVLSKQPFLLMTETIHLKSILERYNRSEMNYLVTLNEHQVLGTRQL